MAKMKVWNDNKTAHIEMFKDDKIEIPAGHWVLMEEDDAVHFRGQYYPMKKNADETPDERFFKMIRLEKHDGAVHETVTPKAPEHLCQLCKYKAAGEADLLEHSKSEHADLIVRDEEIEKEISAKKKVGKKAS